MTLSNLATSALLMAALYSGAQALGPWKQRNAYGGLGLVGTIPLGDTVIASTVSGILRINPDATWERLPSPLNQGEYSSRNRMARVCADGDIGYLYSESGSVFSTMDHGRTWSLVFSGPPYVGIDEFHCGGGDLHLRTSDRLMGAAIGERAWTRTFDGRAGTSKGRQTLFLRGRVILSSGDSLYWKSDTDSAWKAFPGLHYGASHLAATREDAFMVYEEKLMRLDPTSNTWLVADSTLKNIQYLAANGNFLYALMQNKVWRTKDRGKTWEVNGIAQKYHYADSRAISVTDSSCVIEADEGLFLLKPFQSEPRKLASEVLYLTEFLLAHDRDLVATVAANRSGRSMDGGATWNYLSFARPTITQVGSNSRSFFVSGESDEDNGIAELFRSDDWGATWKSISTLPKRKFETTTCVFGDTVFHAASGKLRRSFDNGQTWSSDTGTFPGGYSRVLYTGKTLLAFDSAVHRSSDQGETWKTLPSPILVGNFASDRHIVDGGDRVYLGRHMDLFGSGDEGKTWERIPVPGHVLSSITAAPGLIVIGTVAGGIFMTSDSGKTWSPHNQGLYAGGIRQLVRDGNRIHLITSYLGFFTADMDIATATKRRKPSTPSAVKRSAGVNALGRNGQGGAGIVLPRRHAP